MCHWAALVVFGCAASVVAGTAPSLCGTGEAVVFSCRLEGGDEIVSVCSAPSKPPFSRLTYRFGTAKRAEVTLTASSATAHRFSATVSPVGPRAVVRQLWIQSRDTRYLVTACNGGDCVPRAGLLVRRGDQVAKRSACRNDPADHGWFTPSVIQFGSDVETTRSTTPLIQIEAADNGVEALYPWKPAD